MNPGLPWRLGSVPDFSRNVHCLLGVPIDAADMAGTVAALRQAIRLRQPCFLSTPNLNFLVACQSDPAFRRSLLDSDLAIADGMPLVWVARLLGIPIRERVAGSSLVERLHRSSSGEPIRVFFLGGPEGAAAAAAQALVARPGGLACVGFANPGFGSIAAMSPPELIDRINRSGADFLVVALGAKKGQAWILHNRSRLAVPVASHLGAVINFLAGTVRRAPPWMQAAGLEWLWRIREEPALVRRYWRDGLAFGRLLLTRVLPYALFLRRHRPSAEAIAAAILGIDAGEGRLRLRLEGAWAGDKVHTLRAALRPELLAGRDVLVDLGSASHLDSACLGLLMLLHGYQARQGRSLVIAPVSGTVQKIFRYGCAEYLL